MVLYTAASCIRITGWHYTVFLSIHAVS